MGIGVHDSLGKGASDQSVPVALPRQSLCAPHTATFHAGGKLHLGPRSVHCICNRAVASIPFSLSFICASALSSAVFIPDRLLLPILPLHFLRRPNPSSSPHTLFPSLPLVERERERSSVVSLSMWHHNSLRQPGTSAPRRPRASPCRRRRRLRLRWWLISGSALCESESGY